jgi:hypothetical protein
MWIVKRDTKDASGINLESLIVATTTDQFSYAGLQRLTKR